MRAQLWPLGLVLALVACSSGNGADDDDDDTSGTDAAPGASDAAIIQPDAAAPEGMVYVPAGTFMRGCDSEVDSECEEDEQPYREVTLSAYWIDTTEVTQGAYSECVVAEGCIPPMENYDPSARGNFPVTKVSWTMAKDYCLWKGKLLPTEAQWEKAARGSDGRIYPWGNEAPDCARANFNECGGEGLEVGTLTAGASPYGALDMAGNAIEWVSDYYDGNYYTSSSSLNDPKGPSTGTVRVFRGGSYVYPRETPLGTLRSSDRFVDSASVTYGDLGFRCARSAD